MIAFTVRTTIRFEWPAPLNRTPGVKEDGLGTAPMLNGHHALILIRDHQSLKYSTPTSRLRGEKGSRPPTCTPLRRDVAVLWSLASSDVRSGLSPPRGRIRGDQRIDIRWRL